ncbi:MAG: M42 family metallopeptidase [Ruminococcus sp.]|nr:M42 family metallopeptidase [Ruminococcus sp.]
MELKERLRELCLINGVSGDEDRVREYILGYAEKYCTCRTDPLGSLICFKNGKKQGKSLMICAHMDEVGFIITYINSDGTLQLRPVGGVDTTAAIGKQVIVGDPGIPGVIGSTAIHNIPRSERGKIPGWDSLYIDIGAADREEAEKLISPGDCAYFDSDFTELGGGSGIKSKAIDDRAGCAMMMELMAEELEYDTYFVFNVQEEVGLRGSRASAVSVAPDFALVLESTTAGDIDGVQGAKRVCCLGGGAVVGFMDRSTVYDRELYRLAFDTAEEYGIPCQTKTMIAGGNDAGAIHVSAGGIRTLAVSVPTRYLHSASCVIKTEDLYSSYELVKRLAARIPEV